MTQERLVALAISLSELNRLLSDHNTHAYLPGKLVLWHGQIVPIVQLEGELALQVDCFCSCGARTLSAYAVRDELDDNDGFTVLVDHTHTLIGNLCDADQRNQLLTCTHCLNQRTPLLPSATTPLEKSA